MHVMCVITSKSIRLDWISSELYANMRDDIPIPCITKMPNTTRLVCSLKMNKCKYYETICNIVAEHEEAKAILDISWSPSALCHPLDFAGFRI